jgi:hypothetical protein
MYLVSTFAFSILAYSYKESKFFFEKAESKPKYTKQETKIKDIIFISLSSVKMFRFDRHKWLIYVSEVHF